MLIYPSHPTPAPYHGLPLLRPFNPGYTAIFNVLGNPVTQVKHFKKDSAITIIIFIHYVLKLFFNRYIGLVLGSVGARQMECSFGRSIGKFII